MPLLKILRRDILKTRATEVLRQIARYDSSDLSGEFEPERFHYFAELSVIRKEIEATGLDWSEFYELLADDVELYESGSEDEWYDSD